MQNPSNTVPIRPQAEKRTPPRRVRPITEEALTVRVPQMCQMLNIGPTKAAELIRTGAVESILLGKTRLVRVQSIKALIGADA